MGTSKRLVGNEETTNIATLSVSGSSTKNDKDINNFNEYKGDWWKADGPLKPLHEINPVRLGFIQEQIKTLKNVLPDSAKPYAGLDILDVGCGAGLICEPFARLGANVTGIDASDTALTQARTHAIQQGLDIDYQLKSIEQKIEQPERYDVVLALEVVEHIDNVPLFLNSCAGLLKPGGLLFISTLNRTPISYLKSIVLAEYILKWIPQGTHDWNRFLKPSELSEHLHKKGCFFTSLKGIDYNIFKREWALTRNLSTNYIGCAVNRS